MDSFLRSSAEIFLRVLGAPDPDNGHSAAYSWPERGWALAQHFNLHTQATMRRYGQCVVARRLSFHEAFVVHKRLEESGFRSAVLLLGNDESVSHISLQCTNGHPLLHGNNPSQRAPWRLNCDNCRCEVSDATVFSCRACDEDLCRLCACTAHGSPCRVVIGFGVGEAIPYPPDDAGNAAVTAGLPDLSNLLSHLLIGSSHNSKPGTKQSVIDALETKIIGSGDMFENVDSTCVICLSDFKPGDKVTQLSCNHCFHIGDHKEFGATELQCEGIIPWLKKNNDCKIIVFMVLMVSY